MTLVDGKTVSVRPVFGLEREYLEALPVKTVSELTWVPEAGIRFLARAIAENAGSTLLIHGVGPNHFFNADQKDRALFLVASLTRNIGNMGGTTRRVCWELPGLDVQRPAAVHRRRPLRHHA